jgi:hypothetical protein
MRSFDKRSHSYHGHLVRLDGTIDGHPRAFAVAIGPAAQAKHQIRVGDVISGQGEPTTNPDLEQAGGLQGFEAEGDQPQLIPDRLPAAVARSGKGDRGLPCQRPPAPGRTHLRHPGMQHVLLGLPDDRGDHHRQAEAEPDATMTATRSSPFVAAIRSNAASSAASASPRQLPTAPTHQPEPLDPSSETPIRPIGLQMPCVPPMIRAESCRGPDSSWRTQKSAG